MSADIDHLIRRDGLRSVFQPIVSLGDGCPVGAEALDHPVPEHLADSLGRSVESLRVMLEVTERALAARPAELLRSLEWYRELGWGVALDDIGADRHSLALMPFLRPDVMKLDLRLVQARPSVEVAEIVNAVNAEAERTGATVLAEGIEAEEHLSTAIAMGATLGQGWLYGRPADAPPQTNGAVEAVPLVDKSAPPEGVTPFTIAERARDPRRGTKRHLLAISDALEREASSLGEATVILSAFQRGDRFTPRTRERYAEIAQRAAFVGALGEGMGHEPATGVRGAVIDPGDPLVGEWDVAVVAPHFAGLLAARELGDGGPDLTRRFDFVVTYERDLVLGAARDLMRRIAPHPAPLPAGER